MRRRLLIFLTVLGLMLPVAATTPLTFTTPPDLSALVDNHIAPKDVMIFGADDASAAGYCYWNALYVTKRYTSNGTPVARGVGQVYCDGGVYGKLRLDLYDYWNYYWYGGTQSWGTGYNLLTVVFDRYCWSTGSGYQEGFVLNAYSSELGYNSTGGPVWLYGLDC